MSSTQRMPSRNPNAVQPLVSRVSSQVPRIGVAISGIGGYLPHQTLDNEKLSTMVDTSDEWIVTRTGIRSRHVASPGEATSDLALPASRDAIASAGLKPEDIDLILLATSTGDTPVPPTACWLQKSLGAVNSAAMDVAAACSGFIFATHLAAGMIRSGMHRRVLVVGAETLTRITDYSDRASCILFGDGAGAVVMSDSGFMELLYTSISSDGEHAEMIQMPAGGSRLPASAATLADHQHFLKLKGSEVFKRAVQAMSDAAEKALVELKLATKDIAWLVPHQANQRIMTAVGERLGIDPARVVSDMSDVGNTAAASLPMALARLVREGKLGPGDRVMLVGFGAGATWGCQVFECTRTPTAG